jgi:hypothetical protein
MARTVDNLAILEAAGDIYSMFNIRHYIFLFSVGALSFLIVKSEVV